MKNGEVIRYVGVGHGGAKENITYRVMDGELTVYEVDSEDWEGRKGKAGTSHLRLDPWQLPSRPIKLKKKYRRDS
jgi:hypothetical protein